MRQVCGLITANIFRTAVAGTFDINIYTDIIQFRFIYFRSGLLRVLWNQAPFCSAFYLLKIIEMPLLVLLQTRISPGLY